MSKYIRTKNKVYEVESEYINNESKWIGYNIVGDDMALILKDQVIKQADTIEELIQDNDIIYIHDLYPDAVLVVEGNIKPFGYNDVIKLKEWLKYKFTKFDLYIKQSNGDYHKVAKLNDIGELELI